MPLIAALLILAIQDLADAKRALQNAVQAGDEAAAKSAVDSLVSTQSADAVDALLSSIGLARRMELTREGERKSISSQLHEVEKKWEEVNKAHAKAMEEYNKDKTNKRALDQTNDLAKQSRDCSAKATTLRTELAAVETKVRASAAIGRLLVDSLSSFAAGAGVQRLLSQLKDSKDWSIRAGLAAALEKIKTDEVLDALVAAAAAEREPTVRVALIDAIASQGKKSAPVLGALREALHQTDYWQVVTAALQASIKLKASELVEAIVEAFAKADSRLVYDLQEALRALTGEDKGISAEAWKSWFEAHRAELSSGAFKPPAAAAKGQEPGHTTFFGIPVQSTRIVFVLDRSGSMAEPAGWVPQTDTGDRIPSELQKPAGTRKIDIARWQLKRVLYLLPKGAQFNLIFFHGTFEVYRPQLIKIDDSTRKEAFKYIDSLEPFGATNSFDSMERAMQFAMGADGRLSKEGADTIYLLSDGLPNRGKYTATADILREIARLNAALKMTIHTVWVGTAQPKDDKAATEMKNGEAFMGQLARDNGGRFVSNSTQK